ncbi:MAG: AraC family transcriptional regulator [Capsulimonadales bacterium]|nr:AraC family transcriptional regulator [Capsulimonadales bacterium]
METYLTMVERERHRFRLSELTFSAPNYTITRLIRGGNFDLRTAGLDTHLLCIPFVSGTRLIYRQPTLLQEGVIPSGQITLHPAGHPAHWTAEAPDRVDTLNIMLRPACLNQAMGHHRVDLRPTRWFQDPSLVRLAAILADDVLTETPEGDLFRECVLNALAVRIVQVCSATSPPPATEGKRGRVEVRRAKEILRSDLGRNPTIAALTDATCLSYPQLERLFRAETGESLTAYQRRLRLERARDLLLRTEEPLSVIASLTGFCDQSHLTRHFRRHFGMTPGQCRRQRR